mgnify:CR=1 FL=1
MRAIDDQTIQQNASNLIPDHDVALGEEVQHQTAEVVCLTVRVPELIGNCWGRGVKRGNFSIYNIIE